MEAGDIISHAKAEAYEKHKEYMRNRYQIKGEEVRERNRLYYEKNKARITAERRQKYIEKHGDRRPGKPRKVVEKKEEAVAPTE